MGGVGAGRPEGVPELAGGEDVEAEAEEFAHDGCDHDLASLAAGLEARGVVAEDGVVSQGGQGGHVEQAAEACVARFAGTSPAVEALSRSGGGEG